MDSREIYIQRINRVMDYVAKNLDQVIDLSTMAVVASFSPYHFHRIFTFVTGETPNNFVQRVRLERSAAMLHDNPRESIAEVANRCGFINESAFCRAFKAHFGVTTTEFRKQEDAIFIKQGIRYSKNGTAVSKIGKHPQRVNSQLCTVELTQLIIMDAKIEIRQQPELSTIYVRHMGAFDQIGEAYEKLFRWAGPRGLVGAETRTVTVYLDDPAITTIEKVRQNASIVVPKNVKGEGEVGTFIVPAGKYAVGHFEVGEKEFEQAWNTMIKWLTESGWQPDGIPYEYYYNDWQDHPDHKFIVDICIPVAVL